MLRYMNNGFDVPVPRARASHKGLFLGVGLLVVVAIVVTVVVVVMKKRHAQSVTDVPTFAATTAAPIVVVTTPPPAAVTTASIVTPTFAPTTLPVSSVPPAPPTPLPGSPVIVLGSYGIPPWGTASKFPDTKAQWIWNASGAASAAPANTVPINFSQSIMNSSPTPTPVTISAIVDNNSTVSLNGTVIGAANGGWTGNYPKLSATLAPGTNVLTFAATNAGAGPNPAGILVSVTDASGNVLSRSDGTWVWV